MVSRRIPLALALLLSVCRVTEPFCLAPSIPRLTAMGSADGRFRNFGQGTRTSLAMGDGGEILDWVQEKENALNGAVAEKTGMTFEDAASLVSLGAVLVHDEGGGWDRPMQPTVVRGGTRIKVYTRPRRFPSCHVDWSQRVLHSDPMYLIVNKPADLPCQAVESNGVETAPSCAARSLGAGRLRLAHRLDSCVEGALVLARTAAALREFGRVAQGGGAAAKHYRALCVAPVASGRLVHHIAEGDPRGPRLVRRRAMQGFKRCELRVESCAPFAGGDLAGAGLFEVRLRLVTGRRHQIRAQLAAEGAPVWGDTLYAPVAGMLLDLEGMSEAGAAEAEEKLARAMGECTAPRGRIALQSWRIEFGGVSADAGRAWWELEGGWERD